MNNIPLIYEGQTSTNPAKLYKSQEADVNKLTPQYSRYFALYGKLPVLDFRPLLTGIRSPTCHVLLIRLMQKVKPARDQISIAAAGVGPVFI